MAETIKYRVVLTSKFKKNYKKIKNQKKLLSKLKIVVETLAAGEDLPVKNRDHALVASKQYKNCRECHIAPDWLLIYQIEDDALILTLMATGTHSELFG